jgi:hypothetical protein
VLPQFSRKLVEQQVQDAVRQFFAFENVEFGQTVYLSKIYEIIQDLPGVQGAVISTFARADAFDPGARVPSSGQLSFVAEKGELPTWAGFTVVTSQPALPDGIPNHLVMQGGVG